MKLGTGLRKVFEYKVREVFLQVAGHLKVLLFALPATNKFALYTVQENVGKKGSLGD